MPKILKEEIGERLKKRAAEIGIPNLIDMIADETIGVTEDEILPTNLEKIHTLVQIDSDFIPKPGVNQSPIKNKLSEKALYG
jgi:acetyl-CoA synthase